MEPTDSGSEMPTNRLASCVQGLKIVASVRNSVLPENKRGQKEKKELQFGDLSGCSLSIRNHTLSIGHQRGIIKCNVSLAACGLCGLDEDCIRWWLWVKCFQIWMHTCHAYGFLGLREEFRRGQIFVWVM
ncbi:hypothetical protein CEXT_170141 [Caerostris extrusa]|uniref:Uncharacterized protein n=1 Tax=Caerostris extrusa TaxID=172846 RepID=A0AAV4TFV1_CAEEX|nr:hypothetical protein CEXT_170141 [Caerostris extrusa]